jgi:tRNA (mo5U34)-methyltransferase
VELLARGGEHRQRIELLKKTAGLSSWYPFHSLTALPLIAELIGSRFADIRHAIVEKPVLDLGCADGELACLFSMLGADVDAIDSSATNYNGMAGVKALSELSGAVINVNDIDLDTRFEFPRQRYGLTLFLGTLYHLKNPYYLLEKLAFSTEWCLLSTRIAQFTPRTVAPIDREPVAYLADGREINNDATNYWIFSAAGLLRILQRTRWAVWGTKRVGCVSYSDPINDDADERMFVLMQSRVYSPGLQLRRSHGWYRSDEAGWCWTAKKFMIEVVLPLETPLSGFKFQFYLPDTILVDHQRLTLSCSISGQPCGSIVCREPGLQELEGVLASFALHEPKLVLSFQVESLYAGDGRELGVCVALKPSASSETAGIPFMVF